MASTELGVVDHYRTGTLLDRIISGLRAAGVDPDNATRADLKPVDEFHIGGIAATDALLAQLDISAQSQVLDIGSGLGGTARHIRASTGATTRGVDLTPEFVEVARQLSAMVGDDCVFEVGSALDLPIPDNSVDITMLLHVGMNIKDKARLFSEAFRVLHPGGQFAVYEVMRVNDAEMAFPVPWASTPDVSFLATAAQYRGAAEAAGFVVTAERDRGDFARDFFAKLAAKMKSSGPVPFSLALTMGDKASIKVKNMVENLAAGCYAPAEMICRKPG